MFCPRCSVVFVNKATKSFETSEFKRHYDMTRAKETNAKGKRPIGGPSGKRNFWHKNQQSRIYVPPFQVHNNKWVRGGNNHPRNQWAAQGQGRGKWPSSKTQMMRAQRTKKATLEAYEAFDTKVRNTMTIHQKGDNTFIYKTFVGILSTTFPRRWPKSWISRKKES